MIIGQTFYKLLTNLRARVSCVTSQKRMGLRIKFAQRDDAGAQHILNKARSALAPEQLIVAILQPTMQQIGVGWQRITLSVEPEHFASNLVRQRLRAVIQAQPPPPHTAPCLVAVCAPKSNMIWA